MLSMLSPDTLTLAAVVVGTATGAVIDLRTGRVPNVLTASIACAGLALAASGLGRIDVGAAVGGFGVGLMLMLPGYLFGATGGGDVKLVAAAGTLLGPFPTFWAVLFTLIAGAVIALIVAACRKRVWLTVYKVAFLIQSAAFSSSEMETSDGGNRFAFAPAIAIGTMLAAVLI